VLRATENHAAKLPKNYAWPQEKYANSEKGHPRFVDRQEIYQLAEASIELATAAELHVATAESLTGGLLSATLIDVPGASSVVSGGIVAYDTTLKASLLSVHEQQLRRSGPVDPVVAMQMAGGVRQACAYRHDLTESEVLPVDIGIATTGVAGPDPDAATGLPAGTVFLGVSSARGDRAVQVQCDGSRAVIRWQTVAAALRELHAEIQHLAGS
jgi:nicotinamide-nucleotide amidase